MSPDLAETLRQAISAVSLGQCQAEIAQNWLHLTPNQLAQLKLQLFRNGSNADRNLIQMVDAAVATGQGCWAASMSIDQTAAPKGWESPSRGYWTLGGAAFARLLRESLWRSRRTESAVHQRQHEDTVACAYRTRRSTARPACAGVHSTASGFHANRGFESAGTVHVLSPVTELRRLAYRGQAEVHAVSRLSGRQLQYRSRTRSSTRWRSHRSRADDEGSNHRDAASGAERTAEDPGQLLRRHGVVASLPAPGSHPSHRAWLSRRRSCASTPLLPALRQPHKAPSIRWSSLPDDDGNFAFRQTAARSEVSPFS